MGLSSVLYAQWVEAWCSFQVHFAGLCHQIRQSIGAADIIYHLSAGWGESTIISRKFRVTDLSRSEGPLNKWRKRDSSSQWPKDKASVQPLHTHTHTYTHTHTHTHTGWAKPHTGIYTNLQRGIVWVSLHIAPMHVACEAVFTDKCTWLPRTHWWHWSNHTQRHSLSPSALTERLPKKVGLQQQRIKHNETCRC